MADDVKQPITVKFGAPFPGDTPVTLSGSSTTPSGANPFGDVADTVQAPIDNTSAPLKSHFESTLRDAVAGHVNADGTAKPYTLADAIATGFGDSVTGLMVSGKEPQALPEDVSWTNLIAASVASLAGDVPAMIAGGVVGAGGTAGNPVGATIGAFGLPSALRSVMIDSYRHGEFTTPKEFLSRASGIFLDTAKGAVTGFAMAAVGGEVSAKLAEKAIPALAKKVIVGASELTAMTTVSKGLEGHLPSAKDFVIGGVLLIGANGATKLSRKVTDKLMDLWVKTGVRPQQALHDAEGNPSIKEDLFSDKDIPDAYSHLTEPLGKVAPVAPTVDLPPTLAEAHDSIRSKIVSGVEPIKGKWTLEKMYTAAVESIRPVKTAVDQMLKDSGIPLTDEKNPYVKLTSLRKAAATAEHFIKFGTVDFKSMAKNGKGLQEILKPIGDQMQLFENFLVALRTLELESRNVKSGFDPVKAKTIVDAYKADWAPIAKEVVEFQNRSLDYLRDSGLISNDAAKAIKELNKAYVPFYRVLEDGVAHVYGSATVKNPIKKIKGSTLDVHSPIESIIKNVFSYVALAQKNEAFKLYADLVNKTGADKEVFGNKVKTKIVATNVSTAELAKHIKANGGNVMTLHTEKQPVQVFGENIGADGSVKIEYNPENLADLPVFRALVEPVRPNEIAFFRDGKREVWELPEEIASAMKGLNKEEIPVYMKWMVPFTRVFRAGTIVSPDFLFKNPIRDQMEMFYNTKNGYTPFVDLLKGLSSVIKKDEMFQEYVRSGGAASNEMSIGQEYIKRLIKETEGKTMWQSMKDAKSDPKSLWGLARNVVMSPIDMLAHASGVLENATRLGEYARARAAGKSITTAGKETARGTLDFSRTGDITGALNQIAPFFNVKIQAMDRIIEAAKDNPIQFASKVVATSVIPAVALWVHNSQDQRYADIPKWQKQVFWIYMGDTFTYKWPKSGTDILISSSIESFLDFSQHADANTLADLVASLAGNMIPDPTPTALVAPVEQFANRSKFTGSPIIPQSLEAVLPEYQYKVYTSEVAKGIGRIIGTIPKIKFTSFASPLVIDNYIRQAVGSMGVYAVKIIDKSLAASGITNPPIAPATQLSEIPVVKQFIDRTRPTMGAPVIGEFYDAYSKQQMFKASLNKLIKDGNRDAYNALAVVAKEEMKVDLSGIKDAVTTLNSNIQKINLDPKMSAGDKQQLIENMTYKILILTKTGVTAISRQAASVKNRNRMEEEVKGVSPTLLHIQ